MSCLLDNIRAIKGIFHKHAQCHGGKVSLCRREMERLIQEELAEVIENPRDPQTLELIFQLLDINGDCLVEFNEYLILIFRVATACCCRLESRECREICRAPREQELQGDGKDWHQLWGSKRKGEHVCGRRDEPEVRADERSREACDLELRDGCRRTCPSCKAQEWDDKCEGRKGGPQQQSEAAHDLEPQKDKTTPCQLPGEDSHRRQQYYDIEDVEGENERRRVQLITAELRDDKRKRCHSRERRASEDCQRKLQDGESELLGSLRRWSPIRGRLLRRGRVPGYESGSLERDANPRRTRGGQPARREATPKQGRYCEFLERDSNQECYGKPREVKRRRSRSCGPELREKVERDQQYCECELLGDKRKPQGGALRDDSPKQSCGPENLERGAQRRKSQACKLGLCDDSQQPCETGGLQRGEGKRRSLWHKVASREDVLRRQESHKIECLESDDEGKRPQGCKPGLRECVLKKQQCCESRTLEGACERRRPQFEEERRREMA